MNKPISQLDLLPAPETLAKPALAPEAEAIIQLALAQAGPEPDDFDWRTDDSVVVKPRPGIAVSRSRARRRAGARAAPSFSVVLARNPVTAVRVLWAPDQACRQRAGAGAVGIT